MSHMYQKVSVRLCHDKDVLKLVDDFEETRANLPKKRSCLRESHKPSKIISPRFENCGESKCHIPKISPPQEPAVINTSSSFYISGSNGTRRPKTRPTTAGPAISTTSKMEVLPIIAIDETFISIPEIYSNKLDKRWKRKAVLPKFIPNIREPLERPRTAPTCNDSFNHVMEHKRMEEVSNTPIIHAMTSQESKCRDPDVLTRKSRTAIIPTRQPIIDPWSEVDTKQELKNLRSMALDMKMINSSDHTWDVLNAYKTSNGINDPLLKSVLFESVMQSDYVYSPSKAELTKANPISKSACIHKDYIREWAENAVRQGVNPFGVSASMSSTKRPQTAAVK